MHFVLLGDSTFDNALYTEGGPDVREHLQARLAESDRCTLLAVDGAMILDVYRQIEGVEAMLQRLPADEAPTHVALSVGGNDLLAEIGVFALPASSVGDALLQVRERATRFAAEYRPLLDRVLELRLPTIACTVYNGAFPDPTEARVIETALRVFDDEIVEAARDRDLPVVDLRRVCSEPEDYWNPIEPSDTGGRKIAAAVLEALPFQDLHRAP